MLGMGALCVQSALLMPNALYYEIAVTFGGLWLEWPGAKTCSAKTPRPSCINLLLHRGLRPRLPVTAIAATATTAAVRQGWRSSQFGAGAKPFAPGRLFQGGAGYWIGIRDAQCLWPPAGLAKVANRSPVLQCGGRRS